MEALASSYNELITLQERSSPNKIIGGDFGLPGVGWEAWRTGCTNKGRHEVLLDFLLDNSLSQLVSRATGPTSSDVLGLLVTSSPGLVGCMQAVPGVFDRLAVMFDVDLGPRMPGRPGGRVYQFHRADGMSLKMKARAVLDKFMGSDPTGDDIDAGWCTIESIQGGLLDDYVPYGTAESRHGLPWMTGEIGRGMRGRDGLFHRAGKSDSNIDWADFRKFRSSVAKAIMSSHENYVGNVIGSSLVGGPRCFWSCVGLKGTDNVGVPTLRAGTGVCNSDIDGAEALSDRFHGVFGIPGRKVALFDGVSPFVSIPSLSIGACGVLSQLGQLNIIRHRDLMGCHLGC